MQDVIAGEFFATGVGVINDNFAELRTLAQTLRASDGNSGICSPIVMAQGSDNRHWVIPTGVLGSFIVFDHGLVVRKDLYNVVSGKVVLTYTPGTPYNVTIAWNASGAGLTPPVSLTQHSTLGNHYWVLPNGYGPNVLVFDHRLLLSRSSYKIENGLVVLNYTPATSYDISACWGAAGPGMIPPRPLASIDSTHYQLPADVPPGLAIVIDHGLVVDSSDYSLDPATGIVTTTYTPADTSALTTSWGLPLKGYYRDNVSLTPVCDGSTQDFVLDQEPILNATQLRGILADASQVFYDLYVDYTVIGRMAHLNSAPAAGTTLYAAMMTTVLTTDQAANTSADYGIVKLDPKQYIETDVLDEFVNLNADGFLSFVEWKNGATVVKRLDIAYNVDQTIASKVYTGAGVIASHNYAYTSGLITVSKTLIATTPPTFLDGTPVWSGVSAFANGAATPDIGDTVIHTTANSAPTSITNFLVGGIVPNSAYNGLMITVKAEDGNTKIVHNPSKSSAREGVTISCLRARSYASV